VKQTQETQGKGKKEEKKAALRTRRGRSVTFGERGIAGNRTWKRAKNAEKTLGVFLGMTS